MTELSAPNPASLAADIPPSSLYIDGHWTPSVSGESYETTSPLQAGAPLARVAAGDAEDVRAAVDAAEAAAGAWAASAPTLRAKVLADAAAALTARSETIAACMVEEVGKPLREARGEIARAAQILEYFAGEPLRASGEVFAQGDGRGTVTVEHRPIGVVGLIAPWNFPIAIPVWKTAPALAYGNTVVLKLASEAPLTGLHLAACFAAAGLPAGVLNVLTGPGSVLGAALVEDDRVRAISLTGSVAVGNTVRDAATARGKRVQLEMGGHSPLVVMADAELAAAADAAIVGAFSAAGQKCTGTRRIFVQASVYAEFREMLLDRIAAAANGDPRDPETVVGSLVSERALNEVLEAIEVARAQGADLIAGGERTSADTCVLTPTLFEGVADADRLACEEVFGPVAAVFSFETLEEVLERCNSVAYGLAAAIFSNDHDAVTRFTRGIEAGIVRVNGPTVGADPHVPFGGIKASGFGPHEQGRAAREFFTESVTVYRADHPG